VSHEDLLLLSLRGDLATGDGCSDLGWIEGGRAVLGHNEDGDPSLEGLCTMLTLDLEDSPTVTTWWYPGFLPGNTFTASEQGLVWGVDAITLRDASHGPGRAFLARSLQRTASLEAAIEHLLSQSAAGGFAYCFGDVAGPRIAIVEHAGTESRAIELTGPGPVWHTNHLVHLPERLCRVSESSRTRAATLAQAAPAGGDIDSVLGVLTADPARRGVRADGGSGDALTLCTVVWDLSKGEMTLVTHGVSVTMSIGDFARGMSSGPDVAPDPAGRFS
jgi:hypothetical protein